MNMYFNIINNNNSSELKYYLIIILKGDEVLPYKWIEIALTHIQLIWFNIAQF